ncbi:unnamed protein product [Prunus armeniaca]|uniref:Uncharacterized protein n=1 Tax=Prunus armeniaca TaxID=36596 RepID=A0A6J5UVI2_PRUAR|nr:unnamed protein product [Prunus armeniaca]
MKLFQKLLKNSTFSSPLRCNSTVSSFITSNSTIWLPTSATFRMLSITTIATSRMLSIMTAAAATVSSFQAGFGNNSILTSIAILWFLSILASGAGAALDDGWSRRSWSQLGAQVWLNPLL